MSSTAGPSLICGNRVNQGVECLSLCVLNSSCCPPPPPPYRWQRRRKRTDYLKGISKRKKWLSSMNDLWRKEYLHKVLVSQGEVWTTQPNPLKEKEVVLVADDKEKHLNWNMGVVYKLIVGREGRCRAAVVQVKSGLLMDREKEAAEGEVPPPRRTRSGREIVRPHHLRDDLKCICNMLMQVTRWRMSKAERFRI